VSGVGKGGGKGKDLERRGGEIHPILRATLFLPKDSGAEGGRAQVRKVSIQDGGGGNKRRRARSPFFTPKRTKTKEYWGS